jgi:hypothetical protein
MNELQLKNHLKSLIQKVELPISTAELKSRIIVGNSPNSETVIYVSRSGRIYEGVCYGSKEAINRIQNKTISEKTKCENGYTLKQALYCVYLDAIYPDTHDDNGNLIVFKTIL